MELHRVVTADGLVLDGALHRPDPDVERRLPPDLFLLVHGTGSNFYAHDVLETFARQALQSGSAVLRINTRGHDGIATIAGTEGSVRLGAAYEEISDCRFDLRAWLDFAIEQGFRSVTLVGHSMGGVKAICARAYEELPVTCLIAISPPRFAHAHWMEHPDAEPFREDYRRAEQLVAEGQPEQLMDVRQPIPLVITARGLLAKYGPHDDYDIVQHLPDLSLPVLIILGSKSVSGSPAFDLLPAELERLSSGRANISLELVEGADTGYAGCREAPFEHAERWLRRLG